MTLAEFVREYRAAARYYAVARPDTLHYPNSLRLRGRRLPRLCHCPITAVANRRARRNRFSTTQWKQARAYLGLEGSVATFIVRAADKTVDSLHHEYEPRSIRQIAAIRRTLMLAGRHKGLTL